MTASEYFDSVADAVRRHRNAELVAMHGQPRSFTAGRGSAISDPTFCAMDEHMAALAEMRRMEAVIGDALVVIEGIRASLPRTGPSCAEALELRYIDGPASMFRVMPYAEVGKRLGVHQTTALLWCRTALDWCDHKGLAWIREVAACAQ